MPRRQQIKISAKELSLYDQLVRELSKNPVFKDFDMDSIQLSIMKNKPPAQIYDVDKAIRDLERYMIVNSHIIGSSEEKQIVGKKDLARMIKISRPTLDKWINDGFIHAISSSRLNLFHIGTVLEQLKEYKKNYRKNI